MHLLRIKLFFAHTAVFAVSNASSPVRSFSFAMWQHLMADRWQPSA